ncbi:SRPBCC family protein [Streptomyces sp. NBC_01016]|uniref:type II toxin-antitoxin system RatA family toxin n=1 Tax=Streptomyces sp. NBC_01016 TaxID=2903720 RepID=UPI002253501D|nr:SRPBCC family protein [Streptomyces sp. NBC_01016]MCX4832026.1 SRPBCC family protein [Streptomyces sp. NBC_01016]
MRSVDVTIGVPGIAAEAVYDRVAEFARYPELTPVVLSVTVHDLSETEETSAWEVYFRNGILRWTESDHFDRPTLTITFTQLDGDFEVFEGTWRIAAEGSEVRVAFRAAFDFGIPSLAGILEPVAERVFKETIAQVVLGLFPSGAVLGDRALARTVGGAPAASLAPAQSWQAG